MDSKRFDSLARTIGRRHTRRSTFQTLAAAAVASASARVGLSEEPAVAAQVTAERRFDCLAIGDSCNGNDSRCCSGRCEGKKGKKGKKGKRNRDREDKSKCVAHDEDICTTGQDTCDNISNGVAVPCGFRNRGACFQTTGKAGFCGRIEGGSPPRFRCENCTKDTDCQALGYGGDSACVVCETDCQFRTTNATACVGSET